MEKIGTDLPVAGRLRGAYAVSLGIVALMVAASVAGLAYPASIYPSDELFRAFVPNDVVNLVIGVPILLGSIILARRGQLTGLLLWPGALLYVFYNYLVYLLSVPLNVAYLLHLTLVTSSVYALIGVVVGIDGSAVRERLRGAVPERFGGGVLASLGLLFLVRVLALLIGALINRTPVSATELGLHATDFVVSPAWIIGGIMLWRREALGYVAGLGLLFQASALFVGLILVLILQPLMMAGPLALGDILAVLAMGMLCFLPLGLFVRGAAMRGR